MQARRVAVTRCSDQTIHRDETPLAEGLSQMARHKNVKFCRYYIEMEWIPTVARRGEAPRCGRAPPHAYQDRAADGEGSFLSRHGPRSSGRPCGARILEHT